MSARSASGSVSRSTLRRSHSAVSGAVLIHAPSRTPTFPSGPSRRTFPFRPRRRGHPVSAGEHKRTGKTTVTTESADPKRSDSLPLPRTPPRKPGAATRRQPSRLVILVPMPASACGSPTTRHFPLHLTCQQASDVFRDSTREHSTSSSARWRGQWMTK